LTGGSVSMPGMVELAEDVFNKPARIGIPEYSGHLKDVLRYPKFSAVIGLLREGRAQIVQGQEESKTKPLHELVKKMREWFAGNF